MFIKQVSFLLFFFCLVSYGQQLTITGLVHDKNNNPIAYANVVLTDGDSLVVSGTTTSETGKFAINNIKKGAYLLKISFLGFNSYLKTIELHNDINIGDIELEESTEALEGVTITAKRPTVKRLVDRLVFNVENSTLSDSNVLDVLKHTPGVLVGDQTIKVKRSIPVIYINDKRIYLSSSEVLQLLESTSATNVKSIEVITSPSAKYDADGGVILNIVTKKNVIAGYNGSIFGNYKQGEEYPKYSMGTNHFFKGKRLSSYLNLNISPRKDFEHNNEYLNFTDASSWETDFKSIRKSSNQSVNANIDYKLNDKNNISLTTNILIAPRDQSKTISNSSTEIFNVNRTVDSIFNTLTRSVLEIFNLAYTLDYVHKFKREGEKLTVSGHHTNYDFSTFQDVDTDYFLPNDTEVFRDNRFQTFSSQEIKLYTGQLDYELPINDSEHFETGAKISNINSESVLRQANIVNDVKIEDLLNSDIFLYDETNYAAYASYSNEWENWSLKSGLRFEYTSIKGNSLSTNQINNTDYSKIFPSINVLHKLNDNNEFYFNYNKRIYRPKYTELNPFKYFLNDNAYSTGDPNLKPQIDDAFTLGYTFNKNYTFELYYRYENDPTLELTYQDNEERVLIYKNTNTDVSVSYGLDFTTYSQILQRWNLYASASVFYYENRFFGLENNKDLLSKNQWSFYAQIINYFTLLKDNSLTADVSFLYISPVVVDGPTELSARSSLDLNLRKILFSNRASISIGVTDIFNTKNYTTTTKYLNQDVFFNSNKENRMFTFGFNYKFGNFNLKNNQKNIDLEERERLNNDQK
jgi:outer membrane receptor protein involved in Fe transport